MHEFMAWVNVRGNQIQVHVRANNGADAQRLLEAQYGKNNLAHLPVRVSK